MVYPPSARNTTNLDPETKNAEQLSFFLRNNNKIGASHIIAKRCLLFFAMCPNHRVKNRNILTKSLSLLLYYNGTTLIST